MRLKHLAAVVASSAVVLATPVYAGAATPHDPRATQPAHAAAPNPRSGVASAKALLAKARALATDRSDVAARGLATSAHGHDATLLLRDLSARRHELGAADRKVADRILARPTGGQTFFGERYRTKAKNKCYAHLCVHWVTRGENKPPLFDGRDRDRLPDWVETVGATAEHVWKRQVTQAGYRAPRADLKSRNHGPNKKLDIYLANLGDNGLYGFCTTDDPRRYRSFSVSAYCVIDNDFSRREFRATPLKTLRATVAHEFFHAVQFSYDWLEDAWLLEGTAMWIEDQVYDANNDNRQYLSRTSPFTAPEVPLDYFDGFDYPQYGVWSFFQHLGEKYPTKVGGMPKVVKDIWYYADDSSASRPRQYSTQAVESVLGRRGSSFRAAFAEYSANNLLPNRFYSEGSAWPKARTRGTCQASATPCTKEIVEDLHHMASTNFRVLPPSSGATTIQINLPPEATSPAATVMVVGTSGAVVSRQTVTADGPVVLPTFTTSTASLAYVTLTNASTSFSCWQQTLLSCQGTPAHDGQTASFTVSVAP